MSENVPPSQKALLEALDLSEEILRNIELSELPLANILLKTSRLSRLLNDFNAQKIFGYEASGYPTAPDGVPLEVYQLGVEANREFQEKEAKSGDIKTYIFLESIEQMEQEVELAESALNAAKDPDVSISSANPTQYLMNPIGNKSERVQIKNNVGLSRKRLSGRRSYIYSYALKKHYEIKYSGIADDIFSRIRENVDSAIGNHVPDASQKLAAVYDNLQSENSEDWSNAVHSCRRILQDLADSIFPPQEDRTIKVGNKDKTIKLGKDNYINRLIAFIEDKSGSERFSDIVGSQLRFIGDRLDSVFKAAQKGSHETIVSREEADRYVVYTYLAVGDILSLL